MTNRPRTPGEAGTIADTLARDFEAKMSQDIINLAETDFAITQRVIEREAKRREALTAEAQRKSADRKISA